MILSYYVIFFQFDAYFKQKLPSNPFSSIVEGRYTSPLDVFIKTIKSEGPLGLFKGTIASWFRLGPGITIAFIVYEQLRRGCGVQPI